MFADFIHDAMPAEVAERAITLAGKEATRLGEHPGLPLAMERRARREADQYGARVLGLPQPVQFLTVYDFFDDYLAPMYEVQDRNQEKNWCKRWWDHRSVLMRVTAMWHKYEKMRLDDPAGFQEDFIRFVVDHHMPFLLSAQSPMKNCSPEHQPSRQLPSETRESVEDEQTDGGQ